MTTSFQRILRDQIEIAISHYAYTDMRDTEMEMEYEGVIYTVRIDVIEHIKTIKVKVKVLTPKLQEFTYTYKKKFECNIQ